MRLFWVIFQHFEESCQILFGSGYTCVVLQIQFEYTYSFLNTFLLPSCQCKTGQSHPENRIFLSASENFIFLQLRVITRSQIKRYAFRCPEFYCAMQSLESKSFSIYHDLGDVRDRLSIGKCSDELLTFMNTENMIKSG